jgi:hypothetical protein
VLAAGALAGVGDSGVLGWCAGAGETGWRVRVAVGNGEVLLNTRGIDGDVWRGGGLVTRLPRWMVDRGGYTLTRPSALGLVT